MATAPWISSRTGRTTGSQLFKRAWHWLVAAFAVLGFVLMQIFAGKKDEKVVASFRDELKARNKEKKKDALQDAKKKHDNVIATDVDDWLDDQLGPGDDGAA